MKRKSLLVLMVAGLFAVLTIISANAAEPLMIKDLENATTTVRTASHFGYPPYFSWVIQIRPLTGGWDRLGGIVLDNNQEWYQDGYDYTPENSGYPYVPQGTLVYFVAEGSPPGEEPPPLDIEAGETVTLTYDGGQELIVYLPEIKDPPPYGDITLYVATDGSTYYDEALTQLAQAAPDLDWIDWTVMYEANEMPAVAEPPWVVSHDDGGSFVKNGILTLKGEYDPAKYTMYTQTNILGSNAIGNIIEARIKGISFPYTHYQTIYFRDGTKSFSLLFYEDRVVAYPGAVIYYMDTTDDFHIYRFTMKDSTTKVYVDGVLRITVTPEYNPYNTLQFGNFGSSDWDVIMQWDYLRYYTGGIPAQPTVPAKPTAPTNLRTPSPTDDTTPTFTWDNAGEEFSWKVTATGTETYTGTETIEEPIKYCTVGPPTDPVVDKFSPTHTQTVSWEAIVHRMEYVCPWTYFMIVKDVNWDDIDWNDVDDYFLRFSTSAVVYVPGIVGVREERSGTFVAEAGHTYTLVAPGYINWGKVTYGGTYTIPGTKTATITGQATGSGVAYSHQDYTGTYNITLTPQHGGTISDVTSTIRDNSNVVTTTKTGTISGTVTGKLTTPLTYKLQVKYEDSAFSPPLDVDVSGIPEGPGGSTSYTLTTPLTSGDGTYYWKVRANDGTRDGPWSEVKSFVLKTNKPPVLNPIGNKTVDEGQLLEFTVTATDPNNDPLTFSASNLPQGASFNPVTQVFSWIPDYTQSGVYPNVHFGVSDGELSDSEDITITVNEITQPPLVTITTPRQGEEVSGKVPIRAEISDPNGDPLTVSVYIDGTLVRTLQITEGTDVPRVYQVYLWKTYPDYPDGAHTIKVEVNDGFATVSDSVGVTVANAVNVAGTVYGFPPKRPLAGASIQLFQNGDLKYETSSDASGYYHFDNITPGLYLRIASKEGYRTSKRTRNYRPGKDYLNENIMLLKKPGRPAKKP